MREATGAGPQLDQPESTRVLLFDGVCALCTMSVRFIIQREREESLHFASLQSPLGRDLASAHGVDVSKLDTVVLLEGGVAYVRAEAALRLAARLRFPWCLARVFRFVPGAVRDLVYRWVSRHRYRWFGRFDREWTPPAEIEQRFL